MITKHDWDAALDSWVAAERDRLGGPPSPEEVVAFTRGELSETDAARVRALLVYYPELTPLLDERATPAKPRTFRHIMPVAAGLLIALLGVFVVQSRRQIEEGRVPVVHAAPIELPPLRAHRGPATSAYELPEEPDRYLLRVAPIERREYAAYRIDIVELPHSEVVWTASDVQPIEGAFQVSIPRAFLRAGDYRIDVYGIAGQQPELLDRFPFRHKKR